jgi:hypothetical protein
MKTKYLVRFLSDSAYMDSDLELIDVIQRAIIAGKLKSDNTNYIFDHVDPTKHSKLSRRVNTDHSRVLASNHLKSSIRLAYFKSLHEAASIYFQDILKAASRNGLNADRMVGEHSTNFTSKEVLNAGSFENLVEKIAASIFRQLENERSTKALIEKMNKKLGLNVSEEIIAACLPYFEIRHRIVHAQGKADREFCEKYPEIGAEDGKTIRLSYELIEKARVSTICLIREFDKQIIEKNLVSEEEILHRPASR